MEELNKIAEIVETSCMGNEHDELMALVQVLRNKLEGLESVQNVAQLRKLWENDLWSHHRYSQDVAQQGKDKQNDCT